MSLRAVKTGLLLLILLTAASAVRADSGPARLMGPRPLDNTLPADVRDLLSLKMAPTHQDGSAVLQQARLSGEKAPASLNAIVMMVDFADSLLLGRYDAANPGGFPPPTQRGLYYAAHDSIYFDHLFRDVADYYHDVSGGLFTFHYDVHPRVVNLPQPMGYYGNHPQQGEQSVLLSATVVDSLDGEIDFSAYDTFVLVHAGAGEETDILSNSPEQVYSTYLDADDFREAFEDSILAQPYIASADFPGGEGIDQVLILPECEFQDSFGGFDGRYGSLGVYCFEVGQRLGMLNLSGFTSTGFLGSRGIGEFGLMGYGLFVGLGYIPPHPCAYNKMLMGWLTPMELDAMTGGPVSLTPCERTTDPAAALKVNITGQEFWLAAYRLQDPDGNRDFSFPGDLNGNGIPDFYNADNEAGQHQPAGETFDPTEDIRERLQGAEWDFFMSENSARARWERGAGSGVFIWHVDEGVIRDNFARGGTSFNVDPAHKAVDLEEADGIQDLDSRTPSPYVLGGDDDSFRGEGNSVFGPHTRPDTRTATGVPTGVLMQGFSDVVLDSTAFIATIDLGVTPPDTIMGFTYADTIHFEVTRAASQVATLQPVAHRELPAGVDLRGSHVLLADLDGNATREIILSAPGGRVYAFDGRLNGFLDQDGDSTTVEPLAVATHDGAPVPCWNPPAAAGDVDGDGESEIILSAPAGLYAFNADGSPVRVVPEGHGLYAAPGACALPPVLIPTDRGTDYAPSRPVDVCVVHEENGQSRLTLFRGASATPHLSFPLGTVQVMAPPVYGWDQLVVAVRDTLAQESRLLFCDVSAGAAPGAETILDLDLGPDFVPAVFPVLLGLVDSEQGENSLRYAIVPGVGGASRTLVFDGELRPSVSPEPWPIDVAVHSPLAPGGAFVGADLLGRASTNGAWHTGWPVRPRYEMAVAADSCAAGPLVAALVGTPTPLRQWLMPVRDGRIFAFGLQAEEVDGWPVVAPARSAGTPALGPVRQTGVSDLVAIGTFDRITGVDDSGEYLLGEVVSSLSIYEGVAENDALWPMWGHSPWRNGGWAMARRGHRARQPYLLPQSLRRRHPAGAGPAAGRRPGARVYS